MNLTGKTKKRPSRESVEIVVGGGNVFKDLRRPDADEAFAKVELAHRIYMLIEKSRLTQTQAAKVLGTDRARVSNLMRGRLKEFSIERLFHFLTRLGQDVEVTIRPKRRALGQVHVLAKAG